MNIVYETTICCGHAVAFLMVFHLDWCDHDKTGMIGTVSGMKTPESGMKTPENGRVGDSRRGWEVVAIGLNAQNCRHESR